MSNIGLLMQTQILDPENNESQVQSQFAHLSIQEYLAMSGLLTESADRIKTSMSRFSKSEQYNMALLFLYGLAFDKERGSIISKVQLTINHSAEQTEKFQKVLLDSVTVSICV